MPHTMPIVKMEIEGMRHTLATMLSQYAIEYDSMLQEALAAFCAPENLKRIIEGETDRVLDLVIREEVHNWYRHGPGREEIKRAIAARLSEGTTYTPLDDQEAGRTGGREDARPPRPNVAG